ncbi:pseudouridylate synthase 7 homolog [Sergentomyia squamirostris]
MGKKNHRNNQGGKFHHGHKRKFSGCHGKNQSTEETGSSGRSDREMINLREEDVGITEYVGTTPGFTGIIKFKFSDFQVNEIDSDGNVVKLTDLSVPHCSAKSPEISPEKESEILSAETLEILQKIANDERAEDYEFDVNEMTKEQRTQIHEIIRERFGTSIMSTTVTKGDNEKFINCSKKKNSGRDRNRWNWPHEYIYFAVFKTNLDTMRAASNLALNLGVKAGAITYAGTKDKRAMTTQLFCVKKREPSKIVNAARKTQNVTIGNFSCRPQVLKLGQLRGNRFRLVLREITADPDVRQASLNNFQKRGFINYFGLQRFGNSALIPTFLIGEALLKQQWQLACELILKPRPGDLPEMQRVREAWWKDRDAQKALDLAEKQMKAFELDLLRGMIQHGPNNLLSALEVIPRNTRLLYIHSYQSLIWNRIASKRVRLGLSPLPGDLVLKADAEQSPNVDNIELLEGEEEEAIVEEENPEELSKFKNMVHKMTKEDIELEKYSIFDVVLPLPGHDITYPDNESGEWYRELLENDELSSEKLKQKNKTYSLGGSYRKFMAKPANLTWSTVNYSNVHDILLPSDLDELRKKKMPELSGNQTALILDFCLPPSTYATMALREVLKTDTSTAAQIALNPKDSKEQDDESPTNENSVKKTKI